MTTTEPTSSVAPAPDLSYVERLAAARKRQSALGVALNAARARQHFAETAAVQVTEIDTAAAADMILRGESLPSSARSTAQDTAQDARAHVGILAGEYAANAKECDRLQSEASREEALRRFPSTAKRLRRCISLLEMQDALLAEDADERRELTKLGLSDSHLPRLPIESLGRSDDRSGSASFYARKECERLLSVTDR